MPFARHLIDNGAVKAGICAADDLRPFMTERMTARLAGLPFTPKSAFICSFPFQTDTESGNIARFARVPDYHDAVYIRVKRASESMSAAFPDVRFHPLKNSWPLPAVAAAGLSGIARIGRHGLAIDDVYGSYIALGAVVCDTPLKPSVPSSDCGGCVSGDRCACLDACPTGAAVWDGKRRVLDRSRCIAHITQSKNCTDEQLELLRLSPYVWGCDLCQEVCRYNRSVPVTPIAEFAGNVAASVEAGHIGRFGIPEDRHYSGKYELVTRNLRYAGRLK